MPNSVAEALPNSNAAPGQIALQLTNFFKLLDESQEHKADYAPYHRAVGNARSTAITEPKPNQARELWKKGASGIGLESSYLS
jgi:hypothetical protein